MINIFKMWCNLNDTHEYMVHQISLVFQTSCIDVWIGKHHTLVLLRVFSTVWQVCSVNHPDAWNGIDSLSASGPGRIIHRHVTDQNFWQKTCRKLDLGSAESCKTDYHRGFSCFSNIHSIWTHCLVPMADIWIKHKVVSSNTCLLIHFGEPHSKNTLSTLFCFFGGFMGKDMWEEQN